jgi:hypothetical protein
MITRYPPGIPVVLPGERITEPVLKYLVTGVEAGMFLPDAADQRLNTVRVVEEDRPAPPRAEATSPPPLPATRLTPRRALSRPGTGEAARRTAATRGFRDRPVTGQDLRHRLLGDLQPEQHRLLPSSTSP